jgi:type I restriction enzyme S subunit
MSEWREVKIGDLASRITSGGTPLTKHAEYYDGNIPWLNTKEIKNCRIFETEKCITELGLKNSSAKYIDENSVIVAMYGATAGKVAINKIPLTTNQACCNITLDEEKADYNFIYYLLLSSFDRLDNLTSGAAQQNLNVGLISSLEVLVPDLEEQKAIAEVLSSLDDKIDLLHRQNKTLEELAQMLFRQWFAEEADEGWEDGTIDDIGILKSGKSRPKDEAEINSVPIYGGNGILGYTNQSNAEDESIIIGRVGAYCGSLYFENQPIWVSDNALLGKGKDILFTKFLFYTLKNNELNSMAEGSSHPLLTQGLIKSIPVLIPPVEKLEEFNIQVNSWHEKINFNKRQIKTLENMRDTLLPKLMSGEVRVNNG